MGVKRVHFTFEQIGQIESCFKEKFGIPRQPGLVKEARAVLRLVPPFSQPEAVRGLEAYSHVWIQFVFHKAVCKEFKATVRPPKMGGNKRLGVFATRSNFRPNPIGLSVVELEKVEIVNNQAVLHLRGGDFLEGTPVLDIKPYLSYSDSVKEAKEGYGCVETPETTVIFTDEVLGDLSQAEQSYPQIRQFIIELLQNDPRPGYQKDPERVYGCHIYDYNLKWKQREGVAEVIALEKSL